VVLDYLLVTPLKDQAAPMHALLTDCDLQVTNRPWHPHLCWRHNQGRLAASLYYSMIHMDNLEPVVLHFLTTALL
jgi:hypothetical protein